MKWLKKFESIEDDEIDFHLQQIEDIFLDVKDELGLDKYDGSQKYGIFYNLVKVPNRYLSNEDKDWDIRLWIAVISSEWGPRFSYDTINSKVLGDFESRLKNIGYILKKDTSTYYELMIYLNK